MVKPCWFKDVALETAYIALSWIYVQYFTHPCQWVVENGAV